MAIPCPRCGRQYDVTLFQFGHAVDCDCGERVEAGMPRSPGGPGPRFVCDAMLGRLARWLRVIGCDTAYRADVADAEIARLAAAEQRVILTRDRRLPLEWKPRRCLMVESESVADQLRQVVDAFELDWRSRTFTRCTRCNAVLHEASKPQVVGRVPVRVLLEQSRFACCPGCRRIYWSGSHARRMRRALERILGSC